MKRKKTVLIALLISTFFIFSPLSQLQAEERAEKSYDQVIIYMIDSLSLNDITPSTTPFLWQMQKEWGVGLLNTSAAKNRTIKNACATLSAGKPALGSSYSQLNFAAYELVNGEKAGEVFLRTTGINPQKENIAVLSINVIKNNNLKQNTGEVGTLGEKIKSQGYTTLVIGNADQPGYHARFAPVILMDKKGLVDRGIIDKSANIPDPELPALVWTNYQLLEKQAKETKGKAVMVIEYGDLYRLEAMSYLFSPAEYSQKREQLLRKIDSSIAAIEQDKKEKAASYIINLHPSLTGNNPEALLMPVFIKKAGYKGLLESFSTRREGVITLENLHFSILSSIDGKTEDPVYTKKNEDPINTLKKINRQAVFNLTNQAVILSFHAISAVIAFLLAFLFIVRQKEKKNTWLMLSFPLAIPAALLIMPLFQIGDLWLFILLSSVLAAGMTAISCLLYSATRINPVFSLAALNILLIICDTLSGFNLLKNCIMSYQLINGIRYFGIGNEYMGILIGSVITWTVLAISRYKSPVFQVLSGLLFVITILVLAFPRLGTNFGGTITACVALSFTWLGLHNRRLKTKHFIGIIILTFIVLSLMVLWDLNQPSFMQSHIGKGIRAIMEEGWPAFINIVRTKMLLHLRVINYARLGWLFLALLFLTAFIILKPSSISKNLKQANPILFTGMQGLLLGAITALVFNDSGIIPAGYLFWFAATLFLYMQIEKEEA